jgi:PAS domain S-box-containing protein
MNINKFLTDNFLDSINDYVSILDKESNFIKVNHNQTKIMGYSSNFEILGKSYYQFKGISSSIAEKFIDQDKQVFKKNEPLHYLSYQQYSDGKWHLLLGDKNCILDDAGQVIGIFSQAKDMTDNRLIDFSRFMFNTHKKYTTKGTKSGFDCIITREDKVYGLSKKEMVVLFYFLRGKTAREIADIIFRSEKTIHFHLEAIKSKFGVASKSDLIEKAIHDGFMNIIPDEVF